MLIISKFLSFYSIKISAKDVNIDEVNHKNIIYPENCLITFGVIFPTIIQLEENIQTHLQILERSSIQNV